MAGKMRSPNYPALSLEQVIDAAEKLWKVEKRTAVSHATVATAIGYKSLSGPARVIIGTMRQYGLIDKAESGLVKISDLAVAILHGHGTEKELALSQAGLMPPLFLELSRTHIDASENAIRSYLLTKKQFSEDGARKAARAFRETIAFAINGKKGYTADDQQEQPEDMSGNDSGQNQGGGGSGATSRVPDGVFSLNVPFSKGTINVQVRVTGDAIGPGHLARVRKYLELAESEWDDEVVDPHLGRH